MPKSIVEPQRETPVFREYDVVVLGGGPAGITAAVAAARDGASTLLVSEKRSVFWVEWARPPHTNFCGLHANVRGDFAGSSMV